MQRSLFPIKIVNEIPYEGPGKDLSFLGLDAQSRKYALKINTEQNPWLSLTEWISYHFCEYLQIPHPDFDIVERLDGSRVFGSRWDDSAQSFDFSKMNDADIASVIREAKDDANSIVTLDYFLPNPDRNIGNYLYKFLDKKVRLLAIDWSRVNPFDGWPLQVDCNTVRNWLELCLSDQIRQPDIIFHKLTQIKELSTEHFSAILNAADPSWITPEKVSSLLEWWDSNRHQRCEFAGIELVP